MGASQHFCFWSLARSNERLDPMVPAGATEYSCKISPANFLQTVDQFDWTLLAAGYLPRDKRMTKGNCVIIFRSIISRPTQARWSFA
jgi:hypothetical protein